MASAVFSQGHLDGGLKDNSQDLVQCHLSLPANMLCFLIFLAFSYRPGAEPKTHGLSAHTCNAYCIMFHLRNTLTELCSKDFTKERRLRVGK